MRTATLLIVLALIGLLSRTGAAEGTLSLSEPYPKVGKKIEIRLEGVSEPAKESLWVVHRPNSQTAETLEVGPFDDEGKIWWIPEAPGIANLTNRDPESGDEEMVSMSVAICFSSTPAWGILVMVLAGLLLFGGAGVSLRLALKENI